MQTWYHENPTVQHVGTLPPRNAFTPFAPEQDPFGTEKNSALRMSLNGDWGFAA